MAGKEYLQGGTCDEKTKQDQTNDGADAGNCTGVDDVSGNGIG
jgi:hypothetical protein